MNKLKSVVLFAILLLSSSCAAWGQSMVADVQSSVSDTSIVRYWQSSISIVYSKEGSDPGWFMLVDTMAPEVRRIPVPGNVTVNDFRILNDTVFLGGRYDVGGGNPLGLLACFAIQDFYNASGYYHWAVAMTTSMPDCLYDPGYGSVLDSCQNQIYDITRLAVFDSGGYSKIAFIAKNYIGTISDSRVGIGRARFNGVFWERSLLYNKYAIEEYTDIIATNNYVVAAARTNDSARLALRIFPKDDFLFYGVPLLGDMMYPNKYGQGFADVEVDENVMATALDGDEFALAYHYKKPTEEGLAVRTFDIVGGVATLLQGLNAPVVRQSGSIWKMRDICYSSSHKLLLVLNDFDGGLAGGLSSIVYQFQLPALTTGVYTGRYLKTNSLYALDTFGSMADLFVASGQQMVYNALSLFWENLNTIVSCGRQDDIYCSKTSPSMYTTFMQTNLNIPNLPSGSSLFYVESVEKDVVCSQ